MHMVFLLGSWDLASCLAVGGQPGEMCLCLIFFECI